MQSIDLTLRLPDSMQVTVPESVTASVVREELLSWSVDESSGRLWFLALVVGDRASIRTAVENMASVRRSEFAPIDHETFYVYAEMSVRAVDRVLWAAIERPGVVIVPPVVYTDTGTLQLTALGTGDALHECVDSIPSEIAVTVERVGEHRHTGGSLADRLTHRQLEAVTVARDRGYYRVPRETTLEEVADELGCSASAVSTLLRNAERHLVTAAIGE